MESTTTANKPLYSLKWTHHTNNMLEMFSEHLLQQHLVDITLFCDGQYIKAHKMVLSSCSPYFQEIFKVHVSKHPFIIMNGLSIQTLTHIINFMYKGEINVKDEDLDNLLTAAENMQIKGLCKIRRANKDKSVNSTAKNTKTVENPSNSQQSNGNIATNNNSRKRKQTFVTDTSNQSQSNGKDLSKTTEKPLKISNLIDKEKDVSIENNMQASGSNVKLLGTKPIIRDSPDETTENKLSKIAKPPNAFMIFANEWREKLALEYQDESNKEISVRLGNVWKMLSSPAKEKYYKAAGKMDEEHKQKYAKHYCSKETRIQKEHEITSTPHEITSSSSSPHETELITVKSSSSTHKEGHPNTIDLDGILDVKEEPEDMDVEECEINSYSTEEK